MPPVVRRTVQAILGFIALLQVNKATAQPILTFTTVVNSGLSSPVDLVSANDGTNRLFVVERPGTIKVYNGSTFALLGTFLTMSGNFTTGGERGLLSLAFHPDYENNGYFFVYYTNGAGGVNVDRFKVQTNNPNAADFSTRTNIMSFSKPVVYSNHNGGELNFGPDGNLYFALGDSGSSGDPGNLAQNGNSYWGKMLRINVDNFLTSPYYTVPADNPYVSDPTVLDEIWCKGLRNPWRWSFDRQTGDMWIADVGQNVKEEINFSPANNTGSKNFGWRCYEGFDAFNTSGCAVQSSYNDPIFDYPHNNTSGGFSVTGGYVYRGTEFPLLQGYYICADYVSGNAWLIKPDGSTGNWISSIQPGALSNISTFGEAEDGTLYAATLGGTIRKVLATAVIPVTLSRFIAQRSNVGNTLQWQTNNEINAANFVVEQSMDGSSWEALTTINASNQPNGSSYSYLHAGNFTQTIFYRLKMTDRDGSFRYSATVQVTGSSKQVVIYPTIIGNGVLTVYCNQPVSSLLINDANGRQVYSTNLTNRVGRVQVNLPALVKGLYYVTLQTASGKMLQKIMVEQ